MNHQRLLPRRRIEFTNGIALNYIDEGAGKPIVFIAGLLVNGDLWRKVISPLSINYRCIAFDLPLGAHSVPMPADAELSPRTVARIIGEAISALDLQDVTLVGVDTGGAISQLVFVHEGERIARLVLSNCDAFEAFPPLLLRPFKWLAFIPGGMRILRAALRLRPMQRFLLWLVQRAKPDTALLDSYFAPMQNNDILRDVRKFMRAIRSQDTIEAAKRFATIKKPALLIWAHGDPFFTDALANRLCRTFTQARIEWVAKSKSKTFVAEDAPDEFAQHLNQFIRESSSSQDKSAPAGLA